MHISHGDMTKIKKHTRKKYLNNSIQLLCVTYNVLPGKQCIIFNIELPLKSYERENVKCPISSFASVNTQIA